MPSIVIETPSAPEFRHVILTRFNIRYTEDPNAPSIGVDPDWLRDRFELFNRYCLPSLVAQTQQSFSWILFFDRNTPEPFAEKVRGLAQQYPNIHPVFCDDLPIDRVREVVQSVVPVAPKWLLTTRLDNDDGVHPEFVATLQRAQRFKQAEVLNVPFGIILSGERAYLRRDTSNAFISLSEPFDNFKTVFSITRHVYAHESYPVRQVGEQPMWLQVVHAKNISNRIRGRRIALARALSGYPVLSDLAGKREKPSEILRENLSLSVVRSARDLAVTGVRRTAKLFGIDIRRKAAQVRR
jgi:hypothetical protein